jgi:hypothetical protein
MTLTFVFCGCKKTYRHLYHRHQQWVEKKEGDPTQQTSFKHLCRINPKKVSTAEETSCGAANEILNSANVMAKGQSTS